MLYTETRLKGLGFNDSEIEILLKKKAIDSSIDFQAKIKDEIKKLCKDIKGCHNHYTHFLESIERVLIKEILTFNTLLDSEDILSDYLDINIMSATDYIEKLNDNTNPLHNFKYSYNSDGTTSKEICNLIKLVCSEERWDTFSCTFEEMENELSRLNRMFYFNINVFEKYYDINYLTGVRDIYFKYNEFDKFLGTGYKPLPDNFLILLYEEKECISTNGIVDSGSFNFTLDFIY